MGEFETEAEEVIEREVKPTGNGAHVYVPKEWANRGVKIALLPQSKEDCSVCGLTRTDCEEWVWIDDGGGAFFDICGQCRDQIEEHLDEDICPLCLTTSPEMSKSSGFQQVGSHDYYNGCDECRTHVLHGNSPDFTPHWLE